MKISYLSLSTIPSMSANSIQVMKMCQAFAQNKHDVSLVALASRDRNFAKTDIWSHYGVGEFFAIQTYSRWRLLKLYDFNFRAASYAQSIKSDLVYSRNLGAAMYAAKKGIPTILECHSPIASSRRPQREFVNLIKSSAFLKVVVITNALKNIFKKDFTDELDDNRIIVEHDAVDLERFERLPSSFDARKMSGFPERFSVGYSGHLYPGKCTEVMYEMANRLPDVNFIFIGGLDSDVEACMGVARQKGLNNVFFTGFVSNKILPQYLAACDVLLMPFQKVLRTYGQSDKNFLSTTDWTSPLKMFEYMATKRLLVSSDLPVLREVLNESNSVLCDPQNIDQWVNAVTKAREDTIWAERISFQAFIDVQLYSWKKRSQRILNSIGV